MKPLFIFIDLFCGAGGVTEGAVKARIRNYAPVKVIACVNHDPLAIESHMYNHRDTLHFSEDIRTLNTGQLTLLVNYYRKKYGRRAKIILWASLECTNYSKAKGGLPRDADSRSLPNEMDRYILAIDPDAFLWENVEEFMAWGPLDKNGKPVSRKNGKNWLGWQKRICSMGYRHQWRRLNAADYGAHTKRRRLFGIFAKPGFSVTWPKPTHAETPPDGLFKNGVKPWRPVKECLNFSDEGKSIFTRKKPLVENTLKRIYAGLEKYILTGDGFIFKYYGNGHNIESLHKPAGTITTKDRMALVQSAFLDKGFSGAYNHQSINEPSGAIPTKDHYALIKAVWLDKQYKSDKNHQSINQPAGSILSNPKHCMVQAFIDRQFSLSTRHQSIHEPAGNILTVPKMNLVTVKQAFLMNHTYNNTGHSVDEPAPTLLASRRHFYVNQVIPGASTPEIKPGDSPAMKKIKTLCAQHGITDITTRMLRVPELKKIQGFPDDYYLAGTKTDQKKFIGNSVVPHIVKAWMEALYSKQKQRTQNRNIEKHYACME